MAGINNGVYTKNDVPSLILIKCVWHFLPLAMSYAASECLPRNFLIAECHNWFSYSTISQQKYCNSYKAINDNSKLLTIPAQSQTRWLSIQNAVERIVARVEIAF